MTEQEREVWADVRRWARELKPSVWIFYLDCLGSAALGYGALALTFLEPLGWTTAISLPIAAIFLLRAAYFVHEISHRRRGELPGFFTIWNLLVGLPLAVPSFMVDAHVDHHRVVTYGTANDPEYEQVAQWSLYQHVISVLVVLVVPPALVLRWLGVPLTFISPRARQFVIARASTLATNMDYRRKLDRAETRRFLVLEWASFAFWVAALAIAPWQLLLAWWACTGLALATNQLRTNVAHFYEGTGERMSLQEQVRDSVTLGPGPITEALCPVGTRFHTLHHVLPRLAYHHMPKVHRELMRRLPPDSAYRETVFRHLGAALSFAFRRAARAHLRTKPA